MVLMRRFEHTIMSKAIYPSLRVWLITLDRSDVVRFAIVVPGEKFDNINIFTIINDRLPSARIEVRISVVHELLKVVKPPLFIIYPK